MHPNGLRATTLWVPEHWLAYIAPELMRQMHPMVELPFTVETDVYAFGTVWYELLTGSFPFDRRPAETIIWQVGRGMRPALTHVHATKDIKVRRLCVTSRWTPAVQELLVSCWRADALSRPDFNELFHSLQVLPRKHVRLQRSQIGRASRRERVSVLV